MVLSTGAFPRLSYIRERFLLKQYKKIYNTQKLLHAASRHVAK